MSAQPTGSRHKVPTVLQMEAVECGAASLAMILAYYKLFVPLEELRIQCGVSRDGSKASNMLRAARRYGLVSKGYRWEPASLKKLTGPAIIHWNFNHFLVLEGFKNGKVYLNDPGMGPRTVTEEELDQAFTGVVITFEPGPDFKKGGSQPSIIKALLKRVKGSETALTYSIIIGLLLVIPGIVIPVFTKTFVDEVLLGGRENWLKALLWGMGITAVLRALLTWVQEYYLLRLETKVALSSSGQFIWHVLRLPVEFFQQRSVGDLSMRMQSNDQVAKMLSGQMAKTFLDFMVIIFYVFIMIQYDIVLTLLGVVVAVISVLYLRMVSTKREDMNAKLLQDYGKMQGTAMSGLQMIETLKATGSEGDFFAKWAGYQAKTLNAEQKMGVSNQLLSGVPGLLTALTNTLVLIVGGFRILDGHMTVGMLVAFQSLMANFMDPVNSLVQMGGVLQTLKGDMTRLDDVLKYPVDGLTQLPETSDEMPSAMGGSGEAPATEQGEPVLLDHKLEGWVTLEDVSFGYSPLEPPLIENFSLHLRPGERVALVGSSGSGKSTVAKLVSGLYQPWSGRILFDGRERTELPRQVLTSSIAVVDQDISMFKGTIHDNITLWDPTTSELDVVQAAKDACIHRDVSERPNGYMAGLDEGGTNFSGGQRQRLEISRALVNNPSVLVLDEATSALDPLTEKQLDEHLRRRGCACIIVAHRLSTIRDCDEIIVMEQGKIVERGSHEDLCKTDGHYAKLINMG
ncbi:NHLP family bacteriocin export ABC transporter peptidase/permease/ATPase subunit [Anoxynatronum buryatiense]|uniref:NHLM bacteriocin system ABC transporter, peptidase/ATP-binding protein n=1 Tax=Anoxynatronum buryatiense TaxID=489973 RepID=A0AA45WW69_9CLOT|nr:NHLP family bacteriocin export ABC transporter peptidase/permease/ATPase subunit [Anoxynatronum buryatiense]SMP58049.1 NHLM bacteriocin system ABC transporter, peptidase/ATP-binding protein [Anoxynatronum buryatiense]